MVGDLTESFCGIGDAVADGEHRLGVVRMQELGERPAQQLFGGDPQMVGKQVRINGIPRTVVGILRPLTTFVGTRWSATASLSAADSTV